VSLLDRVHGGYVHTRRVRVLCDLMEGLVPQGSQVLDVGCGEGLLAASLRERRPDITVSGIDVLVRPSTKIPVAPFDGKRIPFGDHSVDVVMFVDVLHHTDDPAAMLREAARAATKSILIKDHIREGVLAERTLRLMDWVGNARHHVVLPFNYWRRQQWMDAARENNLTVASWRESLGLYPWPATWLFDRSLHFIARFDIPQAS
jgi:SAM-dependent methyltransferase